MFNAQCSMLNKFHFFIFSFFHFFILTASAQLDTIVVARDGTGDFRNVAEAIDKCRALMAEKRVIYIKKGS